MEVGLTPLLKRRSIVPLAILLVVATLQVSALYAQYVPIRFAHIPPANVNKGDAVEITARIEGASEVPFSAHLFYRPAGSNVFTPLEMTVDRWNITGTILTSMIFDETIEYYLEAEFSSGKVTDPVQGPASTNLYKFRILPETVGDKLEGEGVVILSPDPGADVSTDDVLIAITIIPGANPVDPSSLKLTLNNVDVTANSTITGDIVLFTIKKLRPGRHHISLFKVEGGREKKLVGWGFSAVSPEAEVQAKKGPRPFRGNLEARYAHEDISNKVRDYGSLSANATLVLGKFNWSNRAFVTSQEKDYLQTQHRFLSMMNYGPITLSVGDVSPQVSEFTLWGSRTRGVNLELRTTPIDLNVVYGEMYRGIEGTIQQYDTLYVRNPSTGDTLKSLIDPTKDSIRVSPLISSGTFRRMVTAFRPNFHISEAISMGFNVMKVKDEVESIKMGREPEDNLVVGVEFGVATKNRRFQLSSETALSLYNSDISGGAMEQAEMIEPVIIVNPNFDPLPIDSSLLDSNQSSLDIAKKLGSELLSSAIAHQTGLTINLFNNELRAGYKQIGRSFHSLGSPGVPLDIKGFFVNDRIRLFDSRLYLSGGFEQYEDNVNKRAPNTTTRKAITGGVAFYSPPGYPNLNFNTRLFDRKNDAVLTVIPLPDGTTDTTGVLIEDNTLSYDVTIDHSFNWLKMEHNAAVAYNHSQSDDKHNPTAKTELATYVLRLSSRQEQTLTTALSVSRTEQNSLSNRSKISYNMATANGRYMLLSDYLWLSAGISVNIAEGGLDPDSIAYPNGYGLDFTRLEFSVGSDWAFAKNHMLSLSAYAVNQADDGTMKTWEQGPLDPATNKRWYKSAPTIIKNKDNPGFVPQNDLVGRLTYTFKF